MLLNKRQCHMLWRMTALFLLTLVFPPYALNGYHGYSVGYAPFFFPPRLPYPPGVGYGLGMPPWLASIDGRVELCQWLAIFVVTSVSLVTMAEGRKKSEEASAAAEPVNETFTRAA